MDMCAMVPKPLVTTNVAITTSMSTSTVTPAVAASSTKQCMQPPKSMCDFSFFAKPFKPAAPAALGAPSTSKVSGIRTMVSPSVSTVVSQHMRGNSKLHSRPVGASNSLTTNKTNAPSSTQVTDVLSQSPSKPIFSVPRNVFLSNVSGLSASKHSSSHGSSVLTAQGSAALALTGNDCIMDHKGGFTLDTDEDNKEIESAFYFESDHMALKGNRDYQNMLRAVVKLEAQTD